MTYETVLYEKQDQVASVTLNRPEKLNALSEGLRRDIHAALEEANRDPEVRAIVMTGAGRAFCAGADLAAGAASGPRTLMDWYDSHEEGFANQFYIRDLHKPVIAAINGYCLGAGFELAITCDMLLASEQAIFGAPEIRHGSIVPSLLPWLIGPQWAKRLILSGDSIDAPTAKRIGLVLEVFPHPQLLDRAFALARRIAHVPPIAVRLNKRAIDGTYDMMGIRQAQAYGNVVGAICHTTMYGAQTSDGRLLDEIRRTQGVHAFLQARDGPFREPWP